MRRNSVALALTAALVCTPAAAWAQGSGITGLVRDTSGAVLPGVTVEASSPALIEKARTVTTDTQGRYSIVDLRPGVYTVTFTLTGFSTVRREGIELTASFTAPLNADMRVGSLEETITVSGDAPIVDTTNVVRRQVVDSETIQSMPTSKNWSTIGVMTVGVFSNQNDVGGSSGEHQNQLKAHGGSFNDRLVQMDGLMIANMACNYSCVGVSTNDASTQELSYEIGAISAETGGGGVRVNIIPKEGGNSFSGSAFANYSSKSLQSSNLDDDAAGAGHPVDRRRRLHLRFELRDRRSDQARQAVVLDGAPLLGLLDLPDGRVLRAEPVRLRVRRRRDPAGHRLPAEHQQRPAPDVADVAA